MTNSSAEAKVATGKNQLAAGAGPLVSVHPMAIPMPPATQAMRQRLSNLGRP